MANKFTNEDIEEIVSKLKWKPNKISYGLMILLILCLISILLIVMHLVIINKELTCKFKKINLLLNNLESKNSYFENKTNNLNNQLLTNSNELRYLTSLSGKGVNKNNLFEQSGYTIPIYENQKEDSSLFTALAGQ
jgi:hypothetical protein